MRIAVIGARCRRQGIGAHLARFLVQAGAEVRALVATTDETVAEAVSTLERTSGHRARGFTNVDAMLDAEPLDALVIASPHVTHATYLERALEAGLHVLCEKPVLWGEDDPVATARRIGRAYLDAGRHLVVNTQWPCTLPTYSTLYPEALASTPTSFWMRMSPSSRGETVLIDAMPHPFSLLYAAVNDPSARLENITFEPTAVDAVSVRFDYVATAARVASVVDLVRTQEQPRPAGYGFNDCLARRDVEMGDYRMFLRSDTERIPLPDPTPMLVRSFLERVESGPPTHVDPAIDPGMPHLATIVDAFAASMQDSSS